MLDLAEVDGAACAADGAWQEFGMYRSDSPAIVRRAHGWQGIEWRFHEHCTSAIDEADDSLRAVIWQIAMGVASKTDENGNFIVEACGQPNMKMARHFLEWQRPEKWGKRRKRHVPHNAGVLVIGGDVTKKPEYDTTASVKARKWKSFSRKFREAKT
jgi:hypothetical protein